MVETLYMQIYTNQKCAQFVREKPLRQLGGSRMPYMGLVR
jgi:hypothetical protein